MQGRCVTASFCPLLLTHCFSQLFGSSSSPFSSSSSLLLIQLLVGFLLRNKEGLITDVRGPLALVFQLPEQRTLTSLISKFSLLHWLVRYKMELRVHCKHLLTHKSSWIVSPYKLSIPYTFKTPIIWLYVLITDPRADTNNVWTDVKDLLYG